MNKELEMFGCTTAQLNEAIENSIQLGSEGQTNGMMAMSILSDAQEILLNDPEIARQYINRAKYIISEKWMKSE